MIVKNLLHQIRTKQGKKNTPPLGYKRKSKNIKKVYECMEEVHDAEERWNKSTRRRKSYYTKPLVIQKPKRRKVSFQSTKPSREVQHRLKNTMLGPESKCIHSQSSNETRSVAPENVTKLPRLTDGKAHVQQKDEEDRFVPDSSIKKIYLHPETKQNQGIILRRTDAVL